MPTEDTIRELTLMLAYLPRWRERKDEAWRSWRSYDWDTLDRLVDEGLMSLSAKMIWWTEAGEAEARQLLTKYGIPAE